MIIFSHFAISFAMPRFRCVPRRHAIPFSLLFDFSMLFSSLMPRFHAATPLRHAALLSH
jgi:hypothetical protein